MKRSLHFKIVTLVVAVVAVAVVISGYVDYRLHEKEAMEEKVDFVGAIADIALVDIYRDSIEGRPDRVRHLLEDIGGGDFVSRILVVRPAGVEEAFMDMKTIEAVREKTGIVREEWTEGHEERKVNVAEGVEEPGFKSAYVLFGSDRSRGPVHYVEEDGVTLTYLAPIEESEACLSCHRRDGSRGILMVSTTVADVGEELAVLVEHWLGFGVLLILSIASVSSFLIRRFVTAPLSETVSAIKGIVGDEGAVDAGRRVRVVSDDEVGELAGSFNEMVDTLYKRETDNKVLMEKVDLARAEWEATFDAIEDLITITDNDFRIIRANRAVAKKLACTPQELSGKICYDIFCGEDSPPSCCPHVKSMETGEPVRYEMESKVFGGTYSVIIFPIAGEEGEVKGFVHVARDVTEERHLKDELIHAEKLKSVGQFVAGIAHELSSPLSGVIGFSDILVKMGDETTMKEIRPSLEKINRESLRTAKIVKNLLAFSRSGKAEKTLSDINKIVEESIGVCELALTSGGVEVDLDLSPDLPQAMVDSFQIQQVFINSINNAIDAMAEVEGERRLTVKTFMKGRIINVSVRDTGAGIPDDLINKVLDPFFTTKGVSRGTGLGLSISHGIMQEHGAWIDIKSKEGEGTTVTFEFPVNFGAKEV